MATESDLRSLLQGPDPEGRPAIDLDAVLTRARRRRRPKVIAAQAIGSVAIVGAVFTGVVATLPREEAAMMATDEAAISAPQAGSGPADADLRWAMDACGAAPLEGESSSWALATELSGAPDALEATLTLVNLGETGIEGEVVPWALTLVRDGVVVGTATFTDAAAGTFALDSGESFAVTLGAVVEPCDASAALEPGGYEVRGVVQVVASDAEGRDEVVYGEFSRVELR